MRRIMTPGKKVGLWHCPFCEQVEEMTEDENPICSNCGAELEQLKDDKPVENKVETEEPKPRRKGGRLPKRKPGTCATCGMAMKNETGYTCKLVCDHHGADDTCPMYIEGQPVGEGK